MSYKQFAERLHHELDEIGVPQRADERVEVFAKLIKAPRFKAQALLSGQALPDEALLQILANEFEVSVDWLLGSDAGEGRH